MKPPPRAKKSLGQNFLVDPNIIQKIVDRCGVHTPSQAIVEIGPGQGALTEALCRQLDTTTPLYLIEKDDTLAERLTTQYANHPSIHVFHADALTFDYTTLLNTPQSLKFIGNLPYNISTPLLFYLLKHHTLIQDLHFMLQKEVADRITATPGTKTYGRLSVMLQYACQVRKLFVISPEAFRPRPKVLSAYVQFLPKHTLPLNAAQYVWFEELVRTAFNGRRKQIKNTLHAQVQPAQFERAQIDPNARPDTLSWQAFVDLTFASFPQKG